MYRTVIVSFISNEKFNDETVEELESLKKAFADITADRDSEKNDDIFISKTQKSIFSDMNGRKSVQEVKSEVDKNGKIVAKIFQKVDSVKNKEEIPQPVTTTKIQIPSGKIYHVTKNDEKESNLGLKRARQGVDKTHSFSEIKYSPHDVAEYIFWTGDEKNVALAVEEFLQEELVTRQEAVNFLQSIKNNLDLMQSQYEVLEKVNDKFPNKESMKRKLLKKENLTQIPKRNLYENQQDTRKLIPEDVQSVKFELTKVDDKDIKQNSYARRMNLAKINSNKKDFESTSKSYSKVPPIAKIFDSESFNDDDYDEIMERLGITGFPQKESSLEEVIFELAKVIFSEGLVKGNREAQKAIQRLSDFLQTQVQHRLLSVNLQKKILDVLLSALMDALSKHPELLERLLSDQIIWGRNSSTSEALKQLLKFEAVKLTDQPKSKEEHLHRTLFLENKKL